MIDELVTKFSAARFPIQEEFILAFLILDPIEAHVNIFGAFLFNGVIGETFGSGVVVANRSWWVGMPQFSQGCTDGDGPFPIDKVGSGFGLSRVGHDVAHDIGDGGDGSAEVWAGGWRVMGMREAVTEEVLAAGTAAVVGLQEVGGVAVRM